MYNHSSISMFGFNGGVYWHVNLIPLPYHTANQQGCGREIPDLYNCVVCRGDEKCSIRSLAQPCNVPARLFNKLHNLAAAAAALHGRISNHVLVASASFLLLDQ